MAGGDRKTLWARAEEQAGTFEAARVAPAAGRTGRAVVVIGVVFVALAGLAALARAPESPPDGPGPESGPTVPAGDRAVAGAGSAAAAAVDRDGGWPPTPDTLVPVRIETPAAGTDALTSTAIAVRGRLRVHAASVRISLQDANRRTLDSTTVTTANLDGGIRPLRAPGFDVELSLPTPRPTGERLWIVVTAYNLAGAPLGATRRAVTIGALSGEGG